jgi:hypothetical protein
VGVLWGSHRVHPPILGLFTIALGLPLARNYEDEIPPAIALRRSGLFSPSKRAGIPNSGSAG